MGFKFGLNNIYSTIHWSQASDKLQCILLSLLVNVCLWCLANIMACRVILKLTTTVSTIIVWLMLYITEIVSCRTMFTDYGLFAWISLTALSGTYTLIHTEPSQYINLILWYCDKEINFICKIMHACFTVGREILTTYNHGHIV